jgi:hypothetical protein
VPIELPGACRELVGLQCGVIGRQQALCSGLRPDTIETLLRTGRWQRMRRGVYATFTGDPCREAQMWAALLRAGPNAVLSHQTAAELFGLVDNSAGPIHVMVPRASQPGRIPGVVTHRVERARNVRHPSLRPPRTRIEDTVLDLAASARSIDEAFSWVFRATGKRLTTAERIRHEMVPRQKMRWRAELLSCMDDVDDGVRSNLEHRYVRDVERPHGLPHAMRQARVIRNEQVCYLDNLYEGHLVCVELDGRTAHPFGERWRDFRRDNAGAEDGIVTLRYGWSDITGHPCETAAQIAGVLRRRGWQGAEQRCGPRCALPLSGRR